MQRRTRTRLVVGTAALLAAGATGGATAVAANDDSGATVSSRSAEAATAAALDATGGGHANAVERDTENGATWEVEVTEPGGDTVDVRLDGRYRVVVIESDGDPAGG